MSATFKLELTITSISARISALKEALNQGQQVIYNNKIQALKEKFIADNPDLTEEELKMVNTLFK